MAVSDATILTLKTLNVLKPATFHNPVSTQFTFSVETDGVLDTITGVGGSSSTALKVYPTNQIVPLVPTAEIHTTGFCVESTEIDAGKVCINTILPVSVQNEQTS